MNKKIHKADRAWTKTGIRFPESGRKGDKYVGGDSNSLNGKTNKVGGRVMRLVSV